jgi:hypothetical protein
MTERVAKDVPPAGQVILEGYGAPGASRTGSRVSWTVRGGLGRVTGLRFFDRSVLIQNTGNLIRLDTATHQQISGFYSSIQPQVTGSASLTVRQWLSTQSFGAQQEFGQQILLRFGVSF